MINLQDLERAFAPITEIGREELTFDASGRSMTVRQVAPDEEVEVARHSRQALAGTGDDADDADKEAALQKFLDRFKQGILCYAIVEIDGMDLRGVDFVATGEELDNGTPIKIPKHKAIEKILSPWPRNVLNAVYVMYGELSTRIELKAEKVITFNPTDLDAEIERLETRMADLKKAKSEQMRGPKDPLADKVRAVNTLGQKTTSFSDQMFSARHEVGADRAQVLEEDDNDSQVLQPEPDEEPPVVVTSAQSRTQSEAPVPLSPKEEVHEAPPEPRQRKPAIPAAAVSPGVDHRAARAAQQVAADPRKFDNIYDSLADVNDEDMLAAEEARLASARAARVEAEQRSRVATGQEIEEAPVSVAPGDMNPAVRAAVMQSRRETGRQQAIGGIRSPKKPPHRFATEMDDAILDMGVGDIRPSTSTPIGKLGGVDTYRMPTAEVSGRTGRTINAADISIDDHSGQSANEKFSNPRMRKVQPQRARGRRSGPQIVDLNKRGK